MLFLGFGKHVFLGISTHKNDASAAAAERYESKRNSRQISTQKSLINVFFLNSIWIILKYFYIFPKSQSLILLQQRKYSGCTTHIIIIIINQDLAPLDIWLGLSRELHGVWSLLLINISPKQRRDDATIRTFINFFSHRQACQRRVKRRAREENMNINHHSSFTSPYVNNIKNIPFRIRCRCCCFGRQFFHYHQFRSLLSLFMFAFYLPCRLPPSLMLFIKKAFHEFMDRRINFRADVFLAF